MLTQFLLAQSAYTAVTLCYRVTVHVVGHWSLRSQVCEHREHCAL